MRISGCLVALLLVLLSTGCASDMAGSTTSTVSSAAQKLADDDAGHSVSSDDVTLGGIARHLQSLDTKCRGNDITVAASVDFAWSDLANHGISESRAEYITELDKNVQGFPPDFDCQGFVAADLTVRETGR